MSQLRQKIEADAQSTFGTTIPGEGRSYWKKLLESKDRFIKVSIEVEGLFHLTVVYTVQKIAQ